MLYSSVYTSQATTPVATDTLLQLLDAARAANSKLDVTGMLLYRDGAFMQALEGEEHTVCRLAEKISQDQRHRGYFVCSRKAIDKRQFGDWSMGFRNLDGDTSLPDLPDASANAGLIRDMLDGHLPIPGPIIDQAIALLWLSGACTSAEEARQRISQ